MKLRSLQVSNFRSLANVNVSFNDLTVLVGKNDAGKSNFLDCIQMLCEGTRSSIRREDFYSEGQNIEMRAVFEGAAAYLPLCDNRNRPRIQERIDRDDCITIRRAAAAPNELEGIEIKVGNTDEFDRPMGIDAALRPMLPEIIYIGVLDDVADQLKGTQKDALGKLMKHVIQAITPEVAPALAAATAEANNLLNVREVNGENVDDRAAQLRELEANITNYLQTTFPTTSVSIRVAMPTVQDILTNADIRIREGRSEDPFYRRGSGLQRVLYLSLLRALADSVRGEAAGVRRPFLLLFEEPEAFLHPSAQLKMRDVLNTISASPNAQVILTTHSPSLVDAAVIESTVCVHRVPAEAPAKPVTRTNGPIRIAAGDRDLLRLFAVQRSSKFLFARGVILVEGVADEHIFTAAASVLRHVEFDAMEICMVEIGGKESVEPFMRILRGLGLRVWALVDLDFLWRGAGPFLADDVRYPRFIERLRAAAPDLPDGATEAQKRELKEQRFALCRNELRDDRDQSCDALTEQGIFVLRNGEIEDYAGMGRNKGKYLTASRDIRAGVRQLEFRDELESIIEAIRL